MSHTRLVQLDINENVEYYCKIAFRRAFKILSVSVAMAQESKCLFILSKFYAQRKIIVKSYTFILRRLILDFKNKLQ